MDHGLGSEAPASPTLSPAGSSPPCHALWVHSMWSPNLQTGPYPLLRMERSDSQVDVPSPSLCLCCRLSCMIWTLLFFLRLSVHRLGWTLSGHPQYHLPDHWPGLMFRRESCANSVPKVNSGHFLDLLCPPCPVLSPGFPPLQKRNADAQTVKLL